ncbi:hypothetical protein HYPSUDRAFT_67777 [Hypholoma sublateritium FD-334 SS-4]|uniref:BHLH domain-containing protein n=1 Tax=Hypholoma sublateritium (strain FD-334 SS-4) TaxID=945553 RepID=A0A0D2MD36_HYPSF|nr:hypothetical protein HYPSUDRAFT_67777 [Hypholoma sublateritium FD-334 SS-4]
MDHRQNRADFSPFIGPSTGSADPASPSSSTGQAPQSPNTQLTMNLLNNLLQIQGLENSIVQGSSSQGSSANSTSPANPFPNHVMLEQQIKLSQLQQLQQLQNQIFQQQIALISGQSPSILPSSPLFDSVARQLGAAGGSAGDQQGYTGLPTPGPSGEIRPQQPQDFVSPSGLVNYLEPLPHALVPPSPSRDRHAQNHTRGHHRQGSASGPRSLDLQRQLMALSHQSGNPAQAQHPSYSQPQPGSPSTFAQHHSSPMFTPTMDHQQQHQQQHQYPHTFNNTHHTQRALHGHDLHAAGMVHSAPAHVAFNIYSGGSNDGGASNIPGLTLGPAGGPLPQSSAAGQQQHRQRLSLSESPRYGAQVHQMHPLTILDQDISPLTSPWLGAHPTSSHSTNPNSTTNSNNPNPNNSNNNNNRHRAGSTAAGGATTGSKRLASPGGDEGGSARKRQSPAIRPTLGMGMSIARLVSTRESGSTSPLAAANAGAGAGKGPTPPPRAESRSASGSASPDPGGVARAKGPDEGGGHAARTRSTSTSAGGGSSAGGSGGGGGRRPYRGSKSTTSTPLLKSTRAGSSSRSRIPASGYASPIVGSSAGVSSGAGGVGVGGAGGGGGEGVHDSPSPVDLNVAETDGVDRSMPPPPLPASVAGGSGSAGASANASKPDSSNPHAGSTSGSNSNSSSNSNSNPGGGGGGGGGDMGSDGMEVDMLGGMMGMGGMGALSGMGFGGLGMGEMDAMMGMDGMGGMNSMNGMGGMNEMGGMSGMGNGMGNGMGGMSGMNEMNSMGGMGMDMGPMGMGMDGIDGMNMSAYGGGMGMMDMSAMGFAHSTSHAHQQSQSQSQQHQGQHQHDEQHHADMPPPNQQRHHQQKHSQQQPLVPVTPASIMNLGRLGITPGAGGAARLGSASASAAAAAAAADASASGSSSTSSTTVGGKKGSKKDKDKERDRGAGRRTSLRKVIPAASPGLKPLLPAGGLPPPSSAPLPSPRIVPSTSSTPHTTPLLSGAPPGVRKTSHKAAEQKRRDSLKTTFDSLRTLLPPIALPTDADPSSPTANSANTPFFHPSVSAPLLPGALPPRGPPKAGGEGPNKGVSKLQLLICGNEYIRLLKARVARRDEEIVMLRAEVGRLRGEVAARGGGAEEVMGELEVDLERDVDAVERSGLMADLGGVSGAQEGAGGADDGMDDGDDDDE